MGASNPTGVAFLPEIIGRKLHLRVPQYAYCILKSWVFGEFLCSSVRSLLSLSLSLVLSYFIQNCLILTKLYIYEREQERRQEQEREQLRE